MRKLNTLVRVTNKDIGEQFDEIDSCNLKERQSYGIVSDTVPNKKDSPLAANILIQKVVLDILSNSNYVHDTDYIKFQVIETGKQVTLKESKYPNDSYNNKRTQLEIWEYGNTIEETLNSLLTAINKVSGIHTTLTDNGLIIYGISYEGDFVVHTENNAIAYFQDISIDVNSGTVVFPNKNAVNVPFSNIKFPYDYITTNDIYRLCLKYSLVDVSVVSDEFGDDVVKYKEPVTSLSIENVDKPIEEQDSICLAVIKVHDGSVHFVDAEGHTYPYNRPWFSPKDIIHRNNVGSSAITKHNPHGIGFDDIDPDNTLHNRLLKDGIIVSPSSAIQDIPGTLIAEDISGSSIIADTTGMYSQYDLPNHPARFYKLRYTPVAIHKIIRHSVSIVNGVEQKKDEEIFLKWIEGTAYLLCSFKANNDNIISISDDITVTYSYTGTAQSTIQKTQGILISPIIGNDVILSEGKNVRLYNSTLDIFHKTNINRYFFINMDKEGNLNTVPSVISNNTLEVESDNTDNVRERSRLAVFLYNTKCSSQLEAPNNAVIYSSNKEFNLFKTNTSYVGGNVYIDSYTSPKENIFKENDDEEWITLDLSKDNTKQLHCSKDIIKKDNVDKGFGHWDLTINLDAHTITHVKGYIVVKNVAYGYTEVSLADKNTTKVLFNEISEDNNVVFIKIDKDISLEDRVNTGSYIINVDSIGEFYVSDIYLEFDYDEVYCRYYIQQKEGSTEVTRLLYDSNKEYPEDVVIVDGDLVKIKRSGIIYDELEDSVNPIFEKASINTNSGFNVEITIYGESNGNSISETVTFDDTFREQPDFNYRLLNNAFTSISKYSIDNTTSKGSVLLLAYPLSNYLNPLRLAYANYKSNNLNDYRDLRKCITTIQNVQDNCMELFSNSCLVL